MNIFSIIMVMFFLINLFRKASFLDKLAWQTAWTIFIYLFVNRGFFIESEVINVDNWQGALIMLFVFLALHNKIRYMSRDVLWFSVFVLISLLILAVFPVRNVYLVGGDGKYEHFMAGSKTYVTTAQFTKLSFFFGALAIVQAFVFSIIFRLLDARAMKKLISILSFLLKCAIVIVCVEYVMKNIMDTDNLYNEIMLKIFGAGTSTYNKLALRGDAYVLTGFTREPAHLTHCLMIANCIFFCNYIVNGRATSNIVWITIAVALMASTGAFVFLLATVFLVFFVCVFYLEWDGNRLGNKQTRILFLIVCVFLFSPVLIIAIQLFFASNDYFTMRMNDLMGVLELLIAKDREYYSSLSSLQSSLVRLFSVGDTLRNWMRRPLLGTGIATTYCHGPSVLSLCEIGLIGMILHWRIYYRPVINACSKKSAVRSIVWGWMAVSTLAGVSMRVYVGVDSLVVAYCMQIIMNELAENRKPHNLVVKEKR